MGRSGEEVIGAAKPVEKKQQGNCRRVHTFGRRVAQYLKMLKWKMRHDPLPVDKVALGWAIGMFYGCVIPFGFQLAVSIPTAVFCKASKIGASAATFITNPVTIIFIYPAQCFIANRLIGGNLSFERISEAMSLVIKAGDYATLMSLGNEIVVSFFIGGFLLALVCVPITYFSVRSIVSRYRKRK